MITIPLNVFLFIYYGATLFGLILVLVDMGHLIHTGAFTLTSFIVTFCCLALLAIIIWLTNYLLPNINWQASVTLWDNAWFGHVFTTEQIFSPFKQ